MPIKERNLKNQTDYTPASASSPKSINKADTDADISTNHCEGVHGSFSRGDPSTSSLLAAEIKWRADYAPHLRFDIALARAGADTDLDDPFAQRRVR